MEKRPRGTFTEEFKKQMVYLYDTGKSRQAIMREYKLMLSALDRWISRINKRKGQQELIFYTAHRRFYEVPIWILEFSEGEMRNLLEYKDEYTIVIGADVDEHTIYLERTGFCVALQKYVRYRAKYIWNSLSGMYEEKIIKIVDSYKPGIDGSS